MSYCGETLHLLAAHLVDRKDKLFKELDKCFNETLPKVLGYQFSNASGAELAAAVRSFYFDNQPLGRDHFADIIDVSRFIYWAHALQTHVL